MKFRIGTPTALITAIISINANAIPADSLMYLHETWSGTYFGTYFGSGQGNVDVSLTENNYGNQINTSGGLSQSSPFTEHGSGNLNGNSTGSLADLFVGYNFHPGWWNSKLIIGGQLEGTYFNAMTLYAGGTRSTIFSSTTISTPGGVTAISVSTGQDTFEYSDNLTSMFTFLGRIGFLATPNLLIYILGGGAEGQFVLSSDEFYAFGDDRNQWQLVFSVGAGLEYQFNNNWSVRGEYRYIHFDIDRTRKDFGNSISTDISGAVSTFTNTIGQNFDGNFDFNMGKIGVVYRFDSFPIGK